MAAEERDIEETEEFTLAVKYVLKRQMKDLITQMREQGEEMVVMAVNIQDGTSTHFGTPLGDCFITEQKSLTNNFVTFCKSNGQKKSKAVGTQYSSKKIAATPKGRAKAATSASTDAPTLKITVPKKMSVGISEQELGGLVGRIVASQLTQNKAKGDGSSGGTKFDALLESIKKGKAPDTPSGVTRSGRKVSNKYLEGIKSARKRVKLEKEDSGDEEIPESFILNQLTDLEAGAMKKVQVKTGDGKNIDVQKTTLAQAEQMEILATSIIKQLENIPNVAQRKQVKVPVEVCIDEDDVEDEIKIDGGEYQVCDNIAEGEESISEETEPMDDAVMEYDDFVDPSRENDDGDDDDDYHVDDNEEFEGRKKKTNKRGRKPAAGSRKNGKGQKKSLVEKILHECDQCGMFIRGRTNLRSHVQRVHLKLKANQCKICPQAFFTNAALDNHMLTLHTRKCDNCESFLVESVPWTEGMDKRSKRNVICPCGTIVSIFTAYGRRRTLDHGEGDGPRVTEDGLFECRTCEKKFKDRKSCKSHELIHIGKRDNTCQVCGEDFMFESSMVKHLEDEHSIVLHECKICKKRYSSEISLKVHTIKVHSNMLNLKLESKAHSSPNKTDLNDKTNVNENENVGEGNQVSDSDVVKDVGHCGAVISQVQDGIVYVTTRSPNMTDDDAQKFVQQAINEGQLKVPPGPLLIALNIVEK
ncbi:uncharacterized protein LOC128242639 isoform X4 [Mya arenaria]|uniref:uncharacterized protein LOC128242639 isoform X4 n=1 Tax=Mya arenaria TaxID=6604 RepID=UPI0022E98B4C|nr:uncharacterized protein LOC128242639 isoform X4 [Mya arenaria]